MATQIGTVIDGKYEILKQIGKGGMSTVYLAMDKRLNKQWAVKEIRKTAGGKNDEIVVNSLIAEANLMKRLDHPALPRIVDIIDNGETIYVIMDYIEGESLDKVLDEFGAQPEDVVISWAMQICDALNYLHSQKPPIIYRDMKPANIMLKPEGNIKIIDFGIAREYKEKNLADTTVLGTKGYASPEHYGSRQTDARSDIYTLGMTMHHLLTGVDPRPADYMYIPVRQWVPELSEGIEAIIDKCTQLEPENRYQNCDELMYDLQHPDQIGSTAKKRKKNRLISFIVSIALAAVFAIGGCVSTLAQSIIDSQDYDKYVDGLNSGVRINPEDNVDCFKRAVELDPDNYEAYFALLNFYLKDGETEKCFDQKESQEFLGYLSSAELDENDEQYATLMFSAGFYRLFLNKERSISKSSSKAREYFSKLVDKNEESFKKCVENFKYEDLLRSCLEISEFFSSSKSELGELKEEDYEELLTNLSTCIETCGECEDLQLDDNIDYSEIFKLSVCSAALSTVVSADDIESYIDKYYVEDFCQEAKTAVDGIDPKSQLGKDIKKEFNKNYKRNLQQIRSKYSSYDINNQGR